MKNVTEIFKNNSSSHNLETILLFLEESGFKNVEKLDLVQCALLFNTVRDTLDDLITGNKLFENILFED